MSLGIRPIICDSCGIQKKKSNHWWFLRIVGKTLITGPLDDKLIGGGEDFHACGESCALKKVQQFYETGSLIRWYDSNAAEVS